MTAHSTTAHPTLGRRIELDSTLLLAAAAVLTAWSAFQSTKWSGVMAIRFNEAAAVRTESAKANSDANAVLNVDVGSFLQWLSAYADELRAGDPPQTDGAYVAEPQRLTGFLALRFRPELRTAFDAWIATNPLTLTRSNAASTPFELPEYRLAARERADELEARGDDRAADAREANQRGDNYVLMTVLFAISLFFAGVSTKLHVMSAQLLSLALSSAALVCAGIVVATFPVKL
jgi:hypothetical protein